MKKSVFFSIALSLSMVFAPSFVSSTSQAASIIGVAHASAAQITTFSDLNTDKVTLVSLGNSDVPVGQYSEKILTNLGIWNNIQPKISFGTNVKEVL